MQATSPWTTKYRPSSSSEFVDNRQAFDSIRKWLNSWMKGTPPKKSAFLFGPPGVGKTISICLLAKELGFDFVEMNASNHRTREEVEHIAGMAAVESGLYMRKKVVLLDELEGMSGTKDRGGLAAISSLVKKTNSPIALVAANAWNPKFIGLRSSCLLIEFKRIPSRSIIPRLREIVAQEGIEAEEEALRVIAERARGDLRSAITDLQALAQGKQRLAYEDVNWLDVRDRQNPIFDVLRDVFNAENCMRARNAIHQSEVDYEMIVEWIYENIPNQLPKNEDLANAMEALSRADLFFRRIRRKQYWGLLPYALENATAGVAMSRTHKPSGWIPFKFPQRIKSLSRSRIRRQIRTTTSEKVSRKCHVSSITAMLEFLPYLSVISTENRKMADGISKWIGLDKQEEKYLRE